MTQRKSAFHYAALTLLAWGALAFGAEYSWAYWPLLVLAAVTGLLGLRVSDRGNSSARPIFLAIGIVACMVSVQLMPEPAFLASHTERAASAADYNALRAAAVLGPALPASPREISIAPDRTAVGLLFLIALSLLLVGTTKAASAGHATRLAGGLTVLAAVVALVGILQVANRSEAVYGFWRPPKSEIPFAPFVNENHFSGWMVMAMSLAAGYFVGTTVGSTPRLQRSWRYRVVWLSSPEASTLVLTAFGMVAMALAMILTLSRGGLLGFTTAAVVFVWWVLRKSTGARRLTGGVALLLIFLAAIVRGGAERTLAQFGGAGLNWGGRKAVWLDTLRIIHDYPWTGTGLNTYGIAMLHYQTTPRGDYFIEAHNDYLQLAAEGGLLLGIPILITIALFIREVWKRFKEGADDERTYWLRAGAVTGLISIAVMEIFDFTLQMPGAAVLFVVLAAIAIHRPDYLARRREARAHRE